ncbi:MAG TPA: prepilin-type N-terminal cleavage/methylation domain-containing protein [Sumerlaeia bacterium]|nr:prepilin-type N-terminal cleavage/methylation domain-containing protein [Sumerlaeia bacterium]
MLDNPERVLILGAMKGDGVMLRAGGALTLIELLIVVAMIAVLAAIAVPNFLEAQVRSKVSRVQNGQRAIATAMESRFVDRNDCRE